MTTKWAIKAVFVDNNGEEKGATIYEEKLFSSKEEALKAINGGYGDLLAQACVIDLETEEDLTGLIFEDLEPIERKGN